MLWLAVVPRRLALDALSFAPDGIARAVTDRIGNRRWVVASNTDIASGTDLGAALALLPQLHAVERNIRAEREALKNLAHAVYPFGQPVHVELATRGAARAPGELPASVVWVEIGASLKLFGSSPRSEQRLRGDGLVPLLAQVQEMLHAQPCTCAVGVAPTLEGAEIAARRQAPQPLRTPAALRSWLAKLPLAALRLAPEVLAALAGSGIQRVGELLAIPLDMLGRRFDGATVDYLDRLTGRVADVRRAVRPPARFERRFELAGEVESTEGLLFPLKRLLQELATYLRARDTGVQEFELQLQLADGSAVCAPVRLLAPSRDAAHFFTVLRERLERLRCVAPVREIHLRAGAFAAPDVPQLDLFDGARRQDAEWRQLLERLSARLGAEAVFGLGLSADHRPEKSWCRLAPGEAVGGPTLAGAERPTWLFDAPRPLAGAPQRCSPPERIESGWWDGDAARDYFVAQADGARLWVFQDRATQRWFLHGLWA